MKLRLLNLTISCLAILAASLSLAQAADEARPPHGDRPSREHMEAIRTCAEKAGIPQPKRGEGKGPGERPQLTEKQKQAMDQCFKDNGIEPPAGPPPHGKRPHNEAE